MSVELYVFSDKQCATMSEWQRAIDAQKLALTLPPVSFADLHGLLPVKMGGSDTTFECGHCDPRGVIETYSEVDFGHQWNYCLAFRCPPDFKACIGAFRAAAAYAVATNGSLFECEESTLMNGVEAVRYARELEQQVPAMEVALQNAVKKLRSQA